MLISVANIQTTLGIDKAAGWGILVAYKDPDSSPRSITIYKGFAQESMIQDDEFDFNNFQTATRGNVLVDFGLVAFDGDATLTADSISLIDSKASVVIADRVNPDNNIANSTISTSGIHNPYLNNSSPSRSRNTFGIDVDQISMVNGLSRNVTSAEAWPSASADVFFISGLALSVEITSPDIEITKSVSSVSGSAPTAVEVGDIVKYKVTATNNGQADASNVQVFDELPADLSSVTSTGANCASSPPQTICKILNSLDAGESATFTISGTINGASQSSAGFFENQASSTYEGPFGTQRAISESVSIKYGALITDLATTVTNVVSLRFDSATGLIVTDVGSGVAQVSINSSLLNPDSFKSIAVSGQNTITAVGADTIRFVAGPNMTITTDDLASPKTITFTSIGGSGASDAQPIKTFNILNNFSAPLLGSAVFAPNANDTVRSVRLTNGKVAGVDLTVGLYRNGTLLNFFTLPAGYFTYAYEDLAYPININDYLTVNVVSGSGVNFSLALFNI
jgi:uncharacterized repeat protein (TIGR01451 family)